MPSVGSGSRVPPGGASGALLQKNSATDYDFAWAIAPKGDKGDPGVTPVFTVTATTLPAGSDATVTQTGTSANPILNFGIPTGAAGTSGSSSFVSSMKWGSD